MKKLFVILLGFFLISPLWAEEDKADTECYEFVNSLLKQSPKFQNLLPDAWITNLVVDIQCENKGHAYGALPSDPKKWDQIITGSVDADITITVRPLTASPKGHPLGGTRETVHVEGHYGYRWQIEDSNFFDVTTLNYQKSNIK